MELKNAIKLVEIHKHLFGPVDMSEVIKIDSNGIQVEDVRNISGTFPEDIRNFHRDVNHLMRFITLYGIMFYSEHEEQASAPPAPIKWTEVE